MGSVVLVAATTLFVATAAHAQDAGPAPAPALEQVPAPPVIALPVDATPADAGPAPPPLLDAPATAEAPVDDTPPAPAAVDPAEQRPDVPRPAPAAPAPARPDDDDRPPPRAATGSASVDPLHQALVSLGADAATWRWAFAGQDSTQDVTVGAGLFPGGSARAELWLYDFVGADGSLALFRLPFKLANGQDFTVTPTVFEAIDVDIAVAVKVRYVFRTGLPGLALGGRVGLRSWLQFVDPQVSADDSRDLTIIPGFAYHTLAVGPELFVPLIIAHRRLELELKADLLVPGLSTYTETPDNPGATTVASGWSVQAAARFDVVGGLFVEGNASTTGAYVVYEGIGDRTTPLRDPVSGERERVRGGALLNSTITAGLAVGYFW